MHQNKNKYFSFAAIIVAAVLFGMVVAGGLNITPGVDADKPAAIQPAPNSQSGTSFAAPDFATLADTVVPSVVSVFNTDVEEPGERGNRRPMDMYHFFFGPQEPEGEQDAEPNIRMSSGSGFFISATGEVLTNYHVIEDADRLEIELENGNRLKVTVVGKDPETDIALLKVDDPERTFPFLSLGDSESLRVGEWVMAVGNPLQLDHTVTVGVVSAKGRALGLTADRSFENYIQTDAAINLGNSGGPLVNVRGEVVGINTAINARGQNLGFAVPINTVNRILSQLRERGKVVRGYLGAQVRDIDQKFQKSLGLDSRLGSYVDDVLPGRAADKAGLTHDDVITHVNGIKIRNTRHLIDTISSMSPGTDVTLQVIRNGATIKVKVELEEREPAGQVSTRPEDDARPQDVAEKRIGIEVAPMTARMRQLYRVGEDINGLVITDVRNDSPAGFEGLREGDVILEVNGAAVDSPEKLIELVNQVEQGGYLRLFLNRPLADRSFHVVLELDE